LFVNHLTRNVKRDHLQEIFSTYGAIKEVDLFVDRRTGMSRGKANIVFEDRSSAEKAQSYLDGV